MPSLQQVRDKANAKLVTFWSELQTRQDAYFAKHGKYFQLLAGSNLTQDGTDTEFRVVPASDETHVIDIDTAWTDIVPFQIEIHEWVIGAERGYKGLVTILHNGNEYRRQRDSNNNDTGWFVVDKTVTI